MSQAQILPADHFSPSVSIHNGRPATTSLEVAKFFGKRHDHVLRSINDLMANTPKEFTAPNFGVSEYTDETGRVLPMFILHRDGFMLLVMGYTGKKAMQIKVAYILAFNKMEAQIAGNALPASQPTVLTPSTADDRKPLRSLVHAWAQIAGTSHTALWPQVKAHFQLARIDDLPVEWIPDALDFVQGKIDGQPKALPEAKPKRTSPPDYRTHGEVKARLRGVQRDLIENANTLLACLDNIDKKVLDAFHNPARRGEIATHTDNVLDHFRRSLLRSKEALENQLNACNDTLSGVIGMARVLENPQAAGKAVMYGVQTF